MTQASSKLFARLRELLCGEPASAVLFQRVLRLVPENVDPVRDVMFHYIFEWIQGWPQDIQRCPSPSMMRSLQRGHVSPWFMVCNTLVATAQQSPKSAAPPLDHPERLHTIAYLYLGAGHQIQGLCNLVSPQTLPRVQRVFCSETQCTKDFNRTLRALFTPNLTHLSVLHGRCLHSDLMDLIDGAPLHNLAFLDVRGNLLSTGTLEALLTLPNLTDLQHLRYRYDRRSNPKPYPKDHTSNLRILDAKLPYMLFAFHIFENIHFPHLHTLHLHNTLSNPDDLQRILSKRPLPALRTLYLPERALSSFRSTFPSLHISSFANPPDREILYPPTDSEDLWFHDEHWTDNRAQTYTV